MIIIIVTIAVVAANIYCILIIEFTMLGVFHP